MISSSILICKHPAFQCLIFRNVPKSVDPRQNYSPFYNDSFCHSNWADRITIHNRKGSMKLLAKLPTSFTRKTNCDREYLYCVRLWVCNVNRWRYFMAETFSEKPEMNYTRARVWEHIFERFYFCYYYFALFLCCQKQSASPKHSPVGAFGKCFQMFSNVHWPFTRFSRSVQGTQWIWIDGWTSARTVDETISVQVLHSSVRSACRMANIAPL